MEYVLLQTHASYIWYWQFRNHGNSDVTCSIANPD